MSKYKKTVFTGSAVALVTPFCGDGVDFDSYGALIDRHIADETSALVVCATTGEASTLSDAEHRECIRFAVERAAGRIPVIAGTGSNNTYYAKLLSAYASDAGADAVLVVTPYYNKTSQAGLVRNYFEIADSVKCPVILYNVPQRTGVCISEASYRELSKHERICAVKEASSNIPAISYLLSELYETLDVYSGNDDQILPLLSLGAKGVVSVLANIMPREVALLCDRFFAGDTVGSRELQLQLMPMISALFSEVNPIPVKAAMEMMGLCPSLVRLPLVPLDGVKKSALAKTLREYGLIN